MMQLPPSSPELSPPLEERKDLFFLTPLSVSAFSAAILQSSDCRPPEKEKLPLTLPFGAFPKLRKLILRAGRLNTSASREGAELQGSADWLGKGNVVGEEMKGNGGRISWDEMPKFLLAGAVSTVVSRTFVAPLERIKLECIIRGPKLTWTQTIRRIWLSEGLPGFWKGNLLNLFRMVPFKSINFVCYDMYCHRLLRRRATLEITSHDRLIGGGISGVAETVFCLPLDTIRTPLVAPGGEALGGVVGCFLKMVKKEGFLSLYKGLAPALISMAPASAVFNSVYDVLKAAYLSRRGAKEAAEVGAMRTLVSGAVAGAAAETVTYPLDVIRRQLQLQQAGRVGLAAAFVDLVRRPGPGSLFSGLVPSTFQVLPSAALSYLFYEMMKSILKID